MARHRRSKRDVVQVNPDASVRYITGILTGANNYIDGLLKGASLYNAWVNVETTLEGKPLSPYKEYGLEDALRNFKPELRTKILSNPYQFIKEDPETAKYLVEKSNYKRVLEVAKYMREAGKEYRDMYPSLLKAKNREYGMALLQNATPVKSKAQLGNILESEVET